jgi:methyl coenzyme M reductase subunit C
MGSLMKRKKARLAGHGLGFDPTQVPIVNGVAEVSIVYTGALNPHDIRRVKDALRARGARSAIVHSGPVENEDLAAVLHQLQERGRPFYGSRVRFVEERGGYPHFELTFDSLD